uniref:TSC22 domain family protein 3 n=1 Tax=Neogobius melanostomus TaxID=47308 RepID=A0A8C6U3W7_9GOBI
MSEDECRSPIGLDCCSCCLDLASGIDDSMGGSGGSGLGALPGSPTSPTVTNFRQLCHQLVYQNLNTDKLNTIMRQDSLESVVRDPCFLLNEGICNSNIDQTMLSILLFFHSASGASVVAIDNKIEQAMDLVKNHLMYAVREEVEILKEQIKELAEKNNQLERENYLLKNLASPEQMEKFQSRIPTDIQLDNQNMQMNPSIQEGNASCTCEMELERTDEKNRSGAARRHTRWYPTRPQIPSLSC